MTDRLWTLSWTLMFIIKCNWHAIVNLCSSGVKLLDALKHWPWPLSIVRTSSCARLLWGLLVTVKKALILSLNKRYTLHSLAMLKYLTTHVYKKTWKPSSLQQLYSLTIVLATKGQTQYSGKAGSGLTCDKGVSCVYQHLSLHSC